MSLSTTIACRRRVSLALTLAAAAIALLALAPGAEAFKRVSGLVGSPAMGPGSDGDQFTNPEGIAINQTGAGGVAAGEVYVMDSSSRRIQEFSPGGAFVRAWGVDVIEPGAPNDTGAGFEVCDTTGPTPNLPSDCQAGATSALAGGFGGMQGVAVDQATGAVYVIDAALRRVQKFTAAGEFLLAFGWDVQVGGVSTFEVCTVSANCQAGTEGEGAGQIGGAGYLHAMAVGPAGDLYVAEPTQRRIQRFGGNGTFLGAWGWNVIPSGQIGDQGSAYERCPAGAAASVGACQEGERSIKDDPGHFGRSIESSPYDLAVDSAGRVYASDVYGGAPHFAHRRVMRFEADGASPSVFLDSASPTNPFLEVEDFSEPGAPSNALAVGPSDHLFVRGMCGPAYCDDLAEGTGQEQRIFEFAPTGVLLDSHLRRSGLRIKAFDVNRTTGDVYAASRAGDSERVFVADDDGAQPPPVVAVDDPTDVGAHSATFAGTVDPNGPTGIPTSYRFEYSRDGSGWSMVTGDPLSPADGDDAQPVNAEVSDLEANATYEVRLVAVKAFGASAEVASPSISFATDGPAPEVETLQAQSFSDTGAVLSGNVNPNNRSTTYSFEYGETPGYGAQVPLAGGVTNGGVFRYVSEQIEGLKPETTYHFRLVAESEAGVTTGQDRTFTTRSAFAGFPGRAFEQVSPRLKEADVQAGAGILYGGRLAPPGPASADGNHTAFTIWGTVDSAEWGGEQLSRVLAHRTADGWQLEDISPRAATPSAATSPSVIGGFGLADLSRQLIFATYPLAAGDPGIYLADSTADQVSPIALFEGAGGVGIAGTGDLSHLAFGSSAALTGEPGAPPEHTPKVFEWHDGELRLGSVQDDGTPFATASQLGSGASINGSVLNAMSADGQHVFFSTPVAPDPAVAIYRRDEGEGTRPVSPSQRTPVDPQGPLPRVYLDATRDQSPGGPAAVFFASKEKLTNAPSNTSPASSGLGDLYRYEVNSDTLVNISAETNDVGGARVLGMLGHSEDGSRVYYVAEGQVLAGKGEAGGRNVYAWHDDGTAAGETRFVAPLGDSPCAPLIGSNNNGFPVGGDACNWTTALYGTAAFRTSRVSSDGRRLLFQSDVSLTGYPTGGANEIYLYEAEAGTTGSLSCLSCDPDGTPSIADADLAPRGASPSWLGTVGQDPVRSLSDDGRNVYFTTPASLLPEDTNGKRDVYGWSEGHLELISTGKSSDDSYFDNASADGSTVFITTREQLVGVDDDGLADVYAARVGGGFDFQNPPPAGVPCVGDGCKPPVSSPPPVPAAGSSSFAGPGNQVATKKKKRHKKKKHKKNSRKHKAGKGKRGGRNG